MTTTERKSMTSQDIELKYSIIKADRNYFEWARVERARQNDKRLIDVDTLPGGR